MARLDYDGTYHNYKVSRHEWKVRTHVQIVMMEKKASKSSEEKQQVVVQYRLYKDEQCAVSQNTGGGFAILGTENPCA